MIDAANIVSDTQDMQRLPTLSVITISYNQAKYLEKTITSVLENFPAGLEYIIIDGGSTDGSVEIIEKYADQLAYWVSEKDHGPAHALNKGLQKCTGAYVYYLNSDDYLVPGAIKKILELVNNHPSVDFFYGPAGIYWEGLHLYSTIYSLPWDTKMYLKGFGTMVQHSHFFKRSSLVQNGISFNEDNKLCWDAEFFIDAYLAKLSFMLHNEVIGVFRIHEHTISNNFALEDLSNFYRRIERKYEIRYNFFVDNFFFYLVFGNKQLIFRYYYSRLLNKLRVFRAKLQNSHLG